MIGTNMRNFCLCREIICTGKKNNLNSTSQTALKAYIDQIKILPSQKCETRPTYQNRSHSKIS